MANPKGAGAFWAKLTPEERSQEMIRRRKVAKRKLAARLRGDHSTDSPFPPEVMNPLPKMISLSSGSIKQRLEALEAALAALKAEIGV